MLPTKEDYEDIIRIFPATNIPKIYGGQINKNWWPLGLCVICKHDGEIKATLQWVMGSCLTICTTCFQRLEPAFNKLGWPNIHNNFNLWARYHLASMPGVEVHYYVNKASCFSCESPSSYVVKLKWRIILCQTCHAYINDKFDQTVANEKCSLINKLLVVAQSTNGRNLHRDIFRSLCVMWANTTHFGEIAAASLPTTY